MVAYKKVWDKRLHMDVLEEIGPKRCPNGHDAVQRPGWRGCDNRGHRIWACSQCWAVTVDPDCGCQTVR
jgi:hypothetical protein